MACRLPSQRCLQMSGDQAVLCSVNTTLNVSNVDACPKGSSCSALPTAFLDAAIGGVPSDLFSGAAAAPCMELHVHGMAGLAVQLKSYRNVGVG